MIQLIPIRAMADYLLDRGDVLEIGSSTSPELRRRTAITDDGKISLPLIGEIDAVGLSLPQLRQKIHDLLVAKKNIHNPDVTVEIVAYRPIYVDGDVPYPGPYPYRPGLTVREVVALANGYDATQLRAAGGDHGDADKYSVELVTEAVRVARLQAALAGQSEIDLKRLPTSPIAAATLSDIVATETQELKTEQDDFDKGQAHLDRMIKTTQQLISNLDQAQHEEEQEIDELHKDAAKARDLLQRGLVQVSRVEDQQRAISGAQVILFDLMARATGARKDLELLNRQFQEAGDKRRIKILGELEQTLGQLAITRALFDAASETPRYTGSARSDSRPARRQGQHFVVTRKGQEASPQRIAATEDTELMPGDRVEVSAATTAGSLPTAPTAAGAAAAGTRP
jgi:polysaccharide biosynthesis/export protein